MAPPPRRHYEDVAIGEALSERRFEMTLTALVVYAAATWDFHRYHYDGAFAAGAGLDGPVMDGQMAGALLAGRMMAWGGPDAFVTRLSYRQKAMVHAGETIVISGAVAGKERVDGRPLVTCALRIAKGDGTPVVPDAVGVVALGDSDKAAD